MNIGKKVLGETLFAKIMKMTFYGHFVAGENRAAIKPVIHRMHSFGVKSILDYSVEEDLSESQAKKIEMEWVDNLIYNCIWWKTGKKAKRANWKEFW